MGSKKVRISPSVEWAPKNHEESQAQNSEREDKNDTIDTIKDLERSPTEEAEDETKYPPFRTVALIVVALYLSMFLVSLVCIGSHGSCGAKAEIDEDRSIVSTAIPRITDEFHSLADVGWYGSAYLLTQASTQLLYGRIYSFLATKTVFLASVGLFEIGSLVSAAAPNSKTFIVGRAIAGLGSSGVFTGCIVISVPLIPLRKRPMVQGVFGAVFGISSVVGPLLGGALTQNVSWRWCFYINLPIGGVAMLIVFFLLKLPSPAQDGLSLKRKFELLDPLGTVCFLPSIICLLLALQWGGTQYRWSDTRIITLLTLFGLLTIAFSAIQVHKKKNATVPLHVLRQRSVASAICYQLFIGAGILTVQFYLPIWFQAVKHSTVVQSGLMLLPLVLALIPGTAVAGALVTVTGYYTPMMIISGVIRCVGSGLLTTFHVDTGHPLWISYQVIYGFGQGLGMMQANMAVQATLPKADIPTGTSLVFFAQALGGAVFLAVAQNVFSHSLARNLGYIPGLDVDLVLNAGATAFRNVVPLQGVPSVLEAYNKALASTMWVVVGLSVAGLLPALTMEWVDIKGRKCGPEILSEEEASERRGKLERVKREKEEAKSIEVVETGEEGRALEA